MLFFIVYGLLLLNTIAFAAFGLDKLKAKRGDRRISEFFLLLLAIIGGSMGALMAMSLFRHKTLKPRFAYGIPVVLVLQCALVAFIVWRRIKSGF